jgi:uncharacterized repeat protein (TIGR03803 family)
MARLALQVPLCLFLALASSLVASGQTYSVLYNFHDADHPSAVVRDSSGNLYGTTSNGGGPGGIIFALDQNGSETLLYVFCSIYVNGICQDGVNPKAGLVRDASGNLYGTTYSGGLNNYGTVFKLDSGGHYAVLYSFCSLMQDGRCLDGRSPQADLTRFIHDLEDTKGLFCYKHVAET